MISFHTKHFRLLVCFIGSWLHMNTSLGKQISLLSHQGTSNTVKVALAGSVLSLRQHPEWKTHEWATGVIEHHLFCSFPCEGVVFTHDAVILWKQQNSRQHRQSSAELNQAAWISYFMNIFDCRCLHYLNIYFCASLHIIWWCLNPYSVYVLIMEIN